MIWFIAEKEGTGRDEILKLDSITFYELLNHYLESVEKEYESTLKAME